jgi:FkbM family methyltransferase
MSALASAKKALLSCLRPLDVAVIRRSSLDNLRAHAEDLRRKLLGLRRKCFLQAMPSSQRDHLSDLVTTSKSQLCQDLFVLSELNFREGGYFVEFGASGGTELSNTYLLERQFGWKGILAEPCRVWHDELRASRHAHVSTKCVWSKSGEKLAFKQAPSPWISTIAAFSDSDDLAVRRKHGRCYEVETISLLDLLSEFGAPREIDYLSLDTEGSEFEILQAFDFSKYRFRTITCEHGFGPMRERIHALLTSHGYVRTHEDLSVVDDWYVLRD